MGKSSIRKEIASLINSIKEHSDNMGDKEHIPQQEFELILHEIEKLYQKAIVYNHLNNSLERISVESPAEKNDGLSGTLSSRSETTEPLILAMDEVAPVDSTVEIVDMASEKLGQEKIPEKKEELLVEKTVIPSINKIQKLPIADISKAIGINDKFQFANELFAGNMQEYSVAVQQLNSLESLEAAMDYFSNLQMLYAWDLENQTVKRFLELVDRRYS
jgi:hypothetical protein